MNGTPALNAEHYDRARWLLTAGAGLWCATILIAPFSGSTLIYQFFARICHQLPDRSWSIAEHQLPVCIRCASIYGGFFISAVLGLRASNRALRFAIAATLAEFILALTVVDLVSLRVITGLFLGMSAAPFVALAFEQMLERAGARR